MWQSYCQRVRQKYRASAWISVVKCETESIMWTRETKWSKSCTTGRARYRKCKGRAAEEKTENMSDVLDTWIHMIWSLWVLVYYAGLSDIISTTITCTQLTLLMRTELRLRVPGLASAAHTHTDTAGASAQIKESKWQNPIMSSRVYSVLMMQDHTLGLIGGASPAKGTVKRRMKGHTLIVTGR